MMILAHTALGPYDEVLFIGVALIFTIFMGISWWRSRNFEPYLEDEEEAEVVE
jgi:hypothetical protein